ncbi:GntR family transcriptional regulator [Paremcibacter congregatus]|uniref:GntR family transcriptional regulator n=2 Tax=Paremcibacter congregatus TaxID=2043170 RepID=A0A2G4YSI7_9PROT|nr:GntR family transcriptional regulator [Paremcibacter congregatus]|tara:strand:- start:2593 stop:3264 length:672 start_codon:yes stop_codon:yes gene_type:complete
MPVKDSTDRKITYETVYQSLYDSIITGRFEPGKTLTIRGLAEELDVSPMPVRESIRRLVALGALEMQTTRRVAVAEMTENRYREIVTARILLEPEISAQAIAHSTPALIRKLETIDDEIEAALDRGDADAYSLKNWEFHFTLYRAAHCPIMLRLIESIWLQFGPFMRIIVGRLGTSYMVDQHINAITALKNKDEDALREAIRQDIYDGMDRIGKKLLGHTATQ